MLKALVSIACLLFVCPVNGANDELAFVQRELKLSQVPSGPRMKINPRVLAREMVLKVSKRLDDYISKHEDDLNKTRGMYQYTTKLADTASARNMLLADMWGEFDSDVTVKILGFLRDPVFLSAAREGVKNMSRTFATFSLRTEKQVNNFILSTSTQSKEDVSKNVDEFFSKEFHIIENVVSSLLDYMTTMLTAAPGYEGVVGDIMGPLVARLKNSTHNRLDSMLHSYIDSRGFSFCKNPMFQFTKDYLPVLEEVSSKVPMLSMFIAGKVPDVAPVANELLEKFGKITGDLAKRLKDDIRLTARKVCGILGLDVAMANTDTFT